MSGYDNERRKQGIYLFLAAYAAFLVVCVVLMFVQNHRSGGGFLY